MFIFRLNGNREGEWKVLKEVELKATTMRSAKIEVTKKHTPSFKRDRNDRTVTVHNWINMSRRFARRGISITGDRGQHLTHYEISIQETTDKEND